MVGASTGQFGAAWAQAELRKVLASTGARVVDLDLPLAKAQEAFDDDDVLIDPDKHARLDQVIGALAETISERDRLGSQPLAA